MGVQIQALPHSNSVTNRKIIKASGHTQCTESPLFLRFSDILFIPFVSIKQVLFPLTLENTKFIAGELSLKVSLVLYIPIGHYKPDKGKNEGNKIT